MIQQPDAQRIVHRATQAMASAAGDLAAQLGITAEHLELAQARIAELEDEAGARDAELGQQRQANELLQERIRQLEQPVDGSAGQDGQPE